MCLLSKHVFSNQFGWYLSFNCIITEKYLYFDNDPYMEELQTNIKTVWLHHEPSKSRLVQLWIYTCYTKTCFFLGVSITCYFSRITYFWSIVLFRCNDFIRSLYYFWTIPKTYYTNHTYLFGSILVYGSLLFLSSAHVMKQEISKRRNYFYVQYDKTDKSMVLP
jgi:hypothetical protein